MSLGQELRPCPDVSKCVCLAVCVQVCVYPGVCVQVCVYPVVCIQRCVSRCMSRCVCQTHAMTMTLKSSQFQGSRRKVKGPTQNPLASILMSDSKV